MTRPTVLHVEDQPSDRALLAAVFAKTAPDLRLCAAVDGEEAIAWIAGRGRYADREAHPRPDLVLLDLKLPRRSGFEVLQWIRKASDVRRLPVVVLTFSREPVDLDLAYALGANAYYVKTVELRIQRDLVRGISELVGLLTRQAAPAV
jgi:CheY-like chemotaxis protein